MAIEKIVKRNRIDCSEFNIRSELLEIKGQINELDKHLLKTQRLYKDLSGNNKTDLVTNPSGILKRKNLNDTQMLNLLFYIKIYLKIIICLKY